MEIDEEIVRRAGELRSRGRAQDDTEATRDAQVAKDNETNWSDWYYANTAGAAGLASSAAGAAEYLTRGAIGGDTREYFDEVGQGQVQQMSRKGQRQFGAAFLPDDEDPSIWSEGVARSLGLKTVGALPSLVASLIPAGAVSWGLRGASLATRAGASAAAAKGTGAVLTAGEVVNGIYERVGQMSDDELIRFNDVYAGYRDAGLDERAARQRLMLHMADVKPIVVGGVSYLLGGIEGQIGGRIGGAAAEGMLRGAKRGALAEGAQEAAEGFLGTGAAELSADQAGIDEFSWRKVLNDTFEGFTVGAIMGGGTGAVSNVGARPEPAPAAAPQVAPAATPAAPATDFKAKALEALPPVPAEAPAAPTPGIGPKGQAIKQKGKKPKANQAAAEVVPEKGPAADVAAAIAASAPAAPAQPSLPPEVTGPAPAPAAPVAEPAQPPLPPEVTEPAPAATSTAPAPQPAPVQLPTPSTAPQAGESGGPSDPPVPAPPPAPAARPTKPKSRFPESIRQDYVEAMTAGGADPRVRLDMSDEAIGTWLRQEAEFDRRMRTVRESDARRTAASEAVVRQMSDEGTAAPAGVLDVDAERLKRSKPEIEEKRRQIAEATRILSENAPATKVESRTKLRERLRKILDDAAAADVAIGQRWKKGTPSPLGYLIDVRDILGLLESGKISQQTINTFLAGEYEARQGNWNRIQERRAVEGDAKMRRATVDEEQTAAEPEEVAGPVNEAAVDVEPTGRAPDTSMASPDEDVAELPEDIETAPRMRERERPRVILAEVDQINRKAEEVQDKVKALLDPEASATEGERAAAEAAEESIRSNADRKIAELFAAGAKVTDQVDARGNPIVEQRAKPETVVEKIKKGRRRLDMGVKPAGKVTLARKALTVSTDPADTPALTSIKARRTDKSVVEIGLVGDSLSVNEVMNLAMAARPTTKIGQALIEQLRRKLRKAVGNVRVHFAEDEEMVKLDPLAEGFYDRQSNLIVIRLSTLLGAKGDPARLAHVIIHEATHALSADALRKSKGRSKGFYDQVEALRAEAERVLGKGPYGVENAEEFLSEVFSNESFQEALARIRLPEALAAQLGMERWEGASLWDTIVAIIRKMAMLPDRSHTLLSAAIKVSEEIFNESVPADKVMYTQRQRNLRAREIAEQRAVKIPAVPADTTLPLILSPENIQAATAEAKSTAADGMRGMASRLRWLALSLSSLDNLRQRYANTIIGPTLEKVVATVQEMSPFGQERRNRADGMAQRWYDWEKENPADADLVAAWATETTMANVNVVKGATEADARQAIEILGGKSVANATAKAQELAKANDHLGKARMDGVQGKALLPSLQRRFAALPAEAQDLMLDMSALYRTMENERARKFAENILAPILSKLSKEQIDGIIERTLKGKLTSADETLIAEPVIVASLRRARELRLIDGFYVPLSRHGKYQVEGWYKLTLPEGATLIEPKDGKTGLGNEIEFQAKKKVDARRAAEKWLRENPDFKLLHHGTANGPVTSDDKSTNDYRHRIVVQNRGYHTFDSATEAAEFVRTNPEKYDLITDFTERPAVGYTTGDLGASQLTSLLAAAKASLPGEKNARKLAQVEDVIRTGAYRLQSGNRVSKHRIRRGNVAGASKDLGRNLLIYSKADSRYMEKLTYGNDTDAGLTEMEKLIKANKDSPDYQALSQMYEELRSRVEAGLQGYDEPHPFIQNLKALSYIDKLGSPSYSFVQAMQPTMTTLPVLAGRYGIGKAGAAISRAYADIGALDATKKGVINTARAARQFARFTIDAEKPLESMRARLAQGADGAEMERLLDLVQRRGGVDPGAGFELASVEAEGQGFVGKGIARVDRVVRQMPQVMEQINRVVTAVATYRLARAAGKPESLAQLEAFNTIQNTQGDYSAINAPKIFNHKIWGISLQFKKYAQMYYALLGDTLYRAFKDADPRERSVARKQLAYLVGVHAIAAGALGIPGLEVVKIAAMTLGAFGIGGGYDDFERWVRKSLDELVGKQAGEVLSRGLPRVLNIDLSSRLGADSLITFGEPRRYEQDSVQSWAWQMFAGAPGSLVADQLKAASLVYSGEYAKGAALLPMPKVLSDAITATQKSVEGTVSVATGKQTQAPIGIGTVALNTVGLKTAGQAEAQDSQGARFAVRGEIEKGNRQATILKNQYAEAKTEGERIKVMARVREFNKSAPEADRLTPEQLRKFAKNYRRDAERGYAKDGFRVRNEREAQRMNEAAAAYNVR